MADHPHDTDGRKEEGRCDRAEVRGLINGELGAEMHKRNDISPERYLIYRRQVQVVCGVDAHDSRDERVSAE